MRRPKMLGRATLLASAILVGSMAMAFAASTYSFNLSVPGGGGFATTSQDHPASSNAPYYNVDFVSATPSRAMNFALANANSVVIGGWNALSPGNSTTFDGGDQAGEEVRLAVGSALLTSGSTSVSGYWTP